MTEVITHTHTHTHTQLIRNIMDEEKTPEPVLFYRCIF